METEHFLSGYCRMADGSRTVAVVMEDGKAQEVDCSFYQCPHAPACGIAEKIRDLLAGENP